jgi:hypothetical protein
MEGVGVREEGLGRRRGRGKYIIFLGLMIKHQRVQMRPVHVRATFCVRESFSAGR